MDLKEIKEMKNGIEDAILVMILDFYKATGLPITRIDFDVFELGHIGGENDYSFANVKAEVKIP